MELRGKTAVVTGAGRGLGRATAIELGARGARVILVSRTREELEEAAAAIRARGGEAHVIEADLADPARIHPLVAQAAALAGPVSILVNNASTLGPVPLRPLSETDCEDIERALAVNLLGPFRLANALMGPMLVRGEGVVVNLSSDASISAYPGWGAYSASKAALDHLTRIWAEELRGGGVRLLAFDPGEMDTRMHAEAMPDADRATLRDPARVARALVELIARDADDSGSRIVAELADAPEVDHA
jgi:NAD(P)-dependent dehydrogenase (short-subunit alcohol dehydrogenase family)